MTETGLRDRQAFDEAQSQFVAVADVDYMRVFNDLYGHVPGDALLQRLASIFAEVGLDARRCGGDEFTFAGNSRQELETKLSEARRAFKEPFEVYADGRNQTIKNWSFGFGIGATPQEARADLMIQRSSKREPPPWL